MANEFVIKNGFISNGDSIVNGSLSAQTLNISSLTSSIDDTKVLTIDDNGVVHTVPISGLTSDTYITGFTYNNSNTFILSDNSGRTFTANINTLTGLTINGNLLVTGTTNLNLISATGLTVDYIDFNLTADPPYKEGRIHWDDNTKTLEIDTDVNGFSIEAGHTNAVRVVNKTNTTLLKGELVWIDGAQGQRPTVTRADYSGDSTSARTLGFVAQNINNNNNGYVITYGMLRGVNTLPYSAGTQLYLYTGGTWTNVRPVAPKHEVRVGIVIDQNATTGIIFVNVMNGYELSELHDVSATTINNLDILQWSSSHNVWKPTSNPTFNSISATTYYNLPFYDAGILSNYSGWSNNGNGSMNLPQVQVGLYDNPNYTPPLRIYTVSSGVTGSGGISSLTDNDTNYIYIEYNGGNPRWVVSTDNSAINGSDVVRFQNVYRIGNFIHNLEWGNEGTGLPNKIANRIDSVNRFARESGLSLGLSGSTGVVTLSSGVAWNGTLRQSLDPVNSQTDIFFQNFHSGGTWVISITADTLNNLYYDNGTDRVEANTGTYLVNWYYRGQEINDHLYEVWGNTGYTSVSEARLSTEPSLPELITSHAFLLGRIIVQKGSLNGIVETAFTQIFQPTTVQEHNDLTGLQGGTSGEYYHLTSNQVNNLALTNTSNNFTSQQTFSGGLNSTVLSGGTLYGDGSNLTNIVTSVNVNTGLSGSSTTGNITLINTAPDKIVTITGGTNISIVGLYPNFGVNYTGQTEFPYLPLSGGTVTGQTSFTNGLISNTISATTISGVTIYGDGSNLTNIVTSINTSSGLSGSSTNGNITLVNTSPDKIVTISGGTGIITGGTYPNFTITNSDPDKTVIITGGTNIQIVSDYPNFGIIYTGQTEFPYLPLSGGTVTGSTTFTNGLNANIISATTISGDTFYGDGRNLQGVPKYYAEPSIPPTVSPIATGPSSIAIGDGAIATGSTVLAFGSSAGKGSSNSSTSNFIGSGAGEDSTFANNSNFIGTQAGNNSVSGYSSNFIGFTAGQGSSNSNNSNFIGLNAGNLASGAIYSNFIGSGAGQLSSNALSSNFIGLFAGYNTSNASYSNLFGYNVGKKVGSNDIGSNNIIIGTNITLPNATANAINLGNVLYGINTYNTLTGSANSTPTSTGKIGIGIITPLNRLHVTDNTDPLRLGGLQTLNTDTEVLTTDTNGVIHKRTYDFVTGLTYNDQNRITVSTTVGSYSASINQMSGLTVNGDLVVNGNYIVSGDTIISGATLFSGTTTMQSTPNAIGDFLTIPTNNLVSRRTSDQVRDDIGYYGLTFAIINGYF